MKRSLHRGSLFLIAFIIGNLFFVGAWGQTKTWVGPQNGSGSWSVANNWSPVGVPTISDNVVIPQGRNVVVNINNAVCKSLHVNNATTASGTSQLIFETGSQLDVNGSVILGNGGQRQGTIDMTNGGKLICSSLNTNNLSSWKPGKGTVELKGDNTLPTQFSGFNNLILSGGNTTAPGSLNVTGTFTVSSGAVFSPNASAIISGSTLTGNGTIQVTRTTATPDFSSQYTIANKTLANLTVDYAGNGDQTINALNYGSLKISGSGKKTPDGNMTVNGPLTLNNGLLEIPANRILTLTSPIITGGPFNSANHIVTQVDPNTKEVGAIIVNNITTSGINIPVGDGTHYLPVTIIPASTSDFSVTVFSGITSDGKPGTPVQPEQRKNAINAVWDVHRVNGSGDVSLTLGWPKDQALEGDYFKTAQNVTKGLTHYTNGKWDDPDGTYEASSNSVTRTGINSFSPFSVGIRSLSVLPVRFSGVKVSEKANGVQIDFTNLTESDVEYYEVERSSDGKSFAGVKRLSPSKNDYGSASYTYLDASAPEGRSVYRIKAVETTGKTIYSGMVSITLGAKNSGMNVHASGGQVAVQISGLPAGKYQFRIFSASGQLIKTENINHSGGSFSQSTPVNNARTGVYIFSVDGPVQMQKRFVVQ